VFSLDELHGCPDVFEVFLAGNLAARLRPRLADDRSEFLGTESVHRYIGSPWPQKEESDRGCRHERQDGGQ
jgi:hypothetical protein